MVLSCPLNWIPCPSIGKYYWHYSWHGERLRRNFKGKFRHARFSTLITLVFHLLELDLLIIYIHKHQKKSIALLIEILGTVQHPHSANLKMSSHSNNLFQLQLNKRASVYLAFHFHLKKFSALLSTIHYPAYLLLLYLFQAICELKAA